MKSKEEIKPEDTKGRKQYLARYVDPHKKVSRPVLESDMERLIDEAYILYNLCYTKRGIYPGAEALAHSQIEIQDSLRFFVTKSEKIIINPVITRHTQHTVDSEEGCLTFPDLKPIMVQRWNKITVNYNTMTGDGSISEMITEEFSGHESKVFQHEIDHLDAKYIYEV